MVYNIYTKFFDASMEQNKRFRSDIGSACLLTFICVYLAKATKLAIYVCQQHMLAQHVALLLVRIYTYNDNKFLYLLSSTVVSTCMHNFSSCFIRVARGVIAQAVVSLRFMPMQFGSDVGLLFYLNF